MAVAEEINKFLFHLKQRIEGLHGIIISDRDGVPVVKAVNCDKVPESSMRPAFLSTFGMATEQASKMGLGKNKSIICVYPHYQVIHFSKLPLVVTLIADSTTNTGSLLNLEPELHRVANELVKAVAESA